MKLFLLSQNHNERYDSYDSIVVAAHSAEDARLITPTNDRWTDSNWCKPEYVAVKYLGEAAPDIEGGVVLASFNAG